MKSLLVILIPIVLNGISAENGDECFRDCSIDSAPRICHFNFTLEYYHTMGPACGDCSQGITNDCLNRECIPADGIERGVMSINRQIPGPPITVCKHDIIVVDVTNKMSGTATTIHWHGFHQKETPYMDGVPFITQCPIPFGTTFRYEFNATEAGTQFYHAHAGHHKANGIYGAIVVYDTKYLHEKLYDYDLPEHIIVGSDWMHDMAEMHVPGLPTKGISPTNVLFNGKGYYSNTTYETQTPLAVFKVQQGMRYRFRLINSAAHTCLWKLQIHNHQMSVISSDSIDVRNTEIIDTLYSVSGERYDFIVDANQAKAIYLIRMKSAGSCEDLNLEQYAILSYDDEFSISTNYNSSRLASDALFSEKRSLNNPDCDYTGATNKNYLCITDLQSDTSNMDDLLTKTVDNRFVLRFDNHQVDNIFNSDYDHFLNVGGSITLVGGINNITLTFPSIPMLTQPDEITNDTFCSSNDVPANCAHKTICPCTHRLKVPLNATVELVLIDSVEVKRGLHHPYHLHGQSFYVVKTGDLIDDENEITVEDVLVDVRNGKKLLALKDTVIVPNKGYAVLRFKAQNPGFWLLHCHYEWHLGVGMGLIIQVGELDQMVKAPENFPKCGSYMPKE